MTFPKDELFEKLAGIEHQRWSDWQKYLHSKLKYVEWKEGEKTMCGYLLDPNDYERWERQIDTDYKDLSEKEKDSDREQVMRYWNLINS